VTVIVVLVINKSVGNASVKDNMLAQNNAGDPFTLLYLSVTSSLIYINQQLVMLKEKMAKEQMRLNTLIEKKDIKIKSQNDQIIKMKSLIKLNLKNQEEQTYLKRLAFSLRISAGLELKMRDYMIVMLKENHIQPA
jgi:hypothetical protein